jgi:glucose-6-phosphate isomerase
MEGPLDKTVTFVSVQSRSDDIEIPPEGSGGHGLSYLAGHTLAELLDFERRATAGALAARGRPSMTIEMPGVDAYHVGELIMMLEIATVIAGELYGVDPLDQPGVELGKGFTYALLRKEGSERAMSEWQRLPRPDPSRLI